MSAINNAKSELERINFGDEDTKVMIEILEKFFDQWDSGGAVHVVAPILQRLIAQAPLSPLTGEDDEWFIHDTDGCYAQNIRGSTVFKFTKDGAAYDIDVEGRPPITFPYWPANSMPPDPLIAM